MFTLTPYEGTAEEVVTDLTTTAQNSREEEVIDVVKDSIAKIVSAMRGYISVTGNGHLNPVAGETGDSVSINIVSLPIPSAHNPAKEESIAPLDVNPEVGDLQNGPTIPSTPISPTEENPESVLQNPPVREGEQFVAPEQGAESAQNISVNTETTVPSSEPQISSDQSTEPPAVQPVQVAESGETTV